MHCPWAGAAGTDASAICVVLCLGGQGTAGSQLPALLLLLQGQRWAVEASVIVSAHGRKERRSSGSHKNSYVLSLDRNQRRQVMLSKESRLQRGFLQDMWRSSRQGGLW